MYRLPTDVQLEITDKCNLRCGHCYHLDTGEMPVSKDFSDEETVELARKLIRAQVYSLVITGGEPLIRPGVLLAVARVAKEAGMFVSINTNLLCVTGELLVELERIGVNSLLVSCPASSPNMYREITRCGSYDIFRSKLTMLMGYNISCLVNMVVTPTNLKLIRSTARDLAALGVRRFAATPASLNVDHPDLTYLLDRGQTLALLEDLDWCADNLGMEVDVLEPLPKCFFPAWSWEKKRAFTRRSCQAGRMSASISNIGDVRPCSHNPSTYGNLFVESLETVWDKMSEYRRDSVPGLCQSCPTVSSCNGACRTNALAITGSISSTDRLILDHISLPQTKQAPIVLDDVSVVNFCGKLRWRRESSGNFSMTTKSNHRNLTIANEETLKFVQWLERSLPLPIKEFSPKGGGDAAVRAFGKIMETLIRKEFVSIG